MSSESEQDPETRRKVASPRRVAANQDNARLSTGPRTAAGKAVSRLNATKHGLRSKIAVVAHEDRGQFERLSDDFHRSIKPRDAVEARIVDDAVSSAWRLDRTILCDTAVLTKKGQSAALIYDINTHERFAKLRRELPSNPRKTAAELRTTAQGCEWMMHELLKLRALLDVRGFWYPSERDVMLNVFGLTTEDLFYDSIAYDIVEAFVSAGWSTEVNGDLARVQALIRSKAPEDMAVWEYRHRVDCLAKSIREIDPEVSRLKLISLIEPEVELLRRRAEAIRPIDVYLRETARDREMVDTSREGELRLRYEAMHRRDFHKSLRELGQYRKMFEGNEIDKSEGLFTGSEYATLAAPNEPNVKPTDPRHEPGRKPTNEARPGAILAVPELEEEIAGAKKLLGFPPKERHEYNDLIDDTVPNLNNLRIWADELEAELNAKNEQPTEDDPWM